MGYYCQPLIHPEFLLIKPSKRLKRLTEIHEAIQSPSVIRAVASLSLPVSKIRTFPQSFLIFLYILLFFLNLSLFSSSFWSSGRAARRPGKALATPLSVMNTAITTRYTVSYRIRAAAYTLLFFSPPHNCMYTVKYCV